MFIHIGTIKGYIEKQAQEALKQEREHQEKQTKMEKTEFYKGMTKEEVLKSINEYRMGNGRDELLSSDFIKTFQGYLIVSASNGSFYQYEYSEKEWSLISANYFLAVGKKLADVFKPQAKPTKEPPFFQGMTKEETIECLILQDFLHDISTANLFVFGHVLVLSWGADGVDLTIECVRDTNDNGRWSAIGENTPYYKDLIKAQQEAPKKEAVNFSDELVSELRKKMETAAIEFEKKLDADISENFERHKQAKGETIDTSKDGLFGKIEDVGFVGSKEDFEKYKAQVEETYKGFPSETIAVYSPKRELIQQAKDELLQRMSEYIGSCAKLSENKAHYINIGWAECIKFMEQNIPINE